MNIPLSSHHLVLGQLNDFLTGAVLPDTLDERYRQKIANNLVLKCMFQKTDILNNISIVVTASSKKASITIDFLVQYHKKIVAVIKYAPGSLVTRRLSNIALSRIIKPYQIPIVISCNGEDAEILDGESGKLFATGLDHFPDKKYIQDHMFLFSFNTIKPIIFEQASRIVYAFEVDGTCSL